MRYPCLTLPRSLPYLQGKGVSSSADRPDLHGAAAAAHDKKMAAEKE